MDAIWSAICSYTQHSSAVAIIKSDQVLEREKDNITQIVLSPTMNLWKLWKLSISGTTTSNTAKQEMQFRGSGSGSLKSEQPYWLYD